MHNVLFQLKNVRRPMESAHL